jgi:signal transduction histidine kinase
MKINISKWFHEYFRIPLMKSVWDPLLGFTHPDSSLSSNILRRAVPGIAAIVLIIILFSLIYERINVKTSMDEKGIRIKDRISQTLVLPFWSLDQVMMDTLIELEIEDENVLGIVVYDGKGSLFTGAYKSDDGSIAKFTDPSLTGVLFHRSVMKVRADFVRYSHNYGYADIFMTDSYYFSQMRLNVVRMVVVLLLISAFLFYYIHRLMQHMVITPVVELSKVVSSFRKKNFSQRVPIVSSDELGDLSMHINEMADTIEKYSVSLESMVAERTSQLLNAEKMAALGELVAGISHEINTPVGTALTAASFLEKNAGLMIQRINRNEVKRSELVGFLHSIEDAMTLTLSNLGRASELIQSFKKIAVDRTSDEKRLFRIKEYLHDILISLKPRFKRTNHNIEIKCADDLEIESYPGALSQVLTNLILNSLIHAFPNDDFGGQIMISVEKNDDNVVINYSDNGTGIPQENIPKIYLPFFTTKRGVGGSGLGLNIVFNLVTHKLGGTIECTSRLGKGTVFIIKFLSG